MNDKNEMKWVVVHEAAGEMDAEIIKGLLVSNGIECLIDESTTTHEITGLPVNANIPILVQEKDAAVATALIDRRPPDES